MLKPLVSCLGLTKAGREVWLRKAVECFLAQTYEPRELVIVADEGMRVAVPEDARIRVVYAPRGIVLGAKRNFACVQAAGDVLAHWDDDDWSAPERLAVQMARLEESGRALTGFRLLKFTDGSRWWMYRGDPAFPVGTSLCFRKDWWEQSPFPHLAIASDVPFAYSAMRAGQADVIDAGDLMYANMHPDSTNKRSMAGSCWAACDPVSGKAAAAA